jgi:hypothetical protein
MKDETIWVLIEQQEGSEAEPIFVSEDKEYLENCIKSLNPYQIDLENYRKAYNDFAKECRKECGDFTEEYFKNMSLWQTGNPFKSIHKNLYTRYFVKWAALKVKDE